MLESENTNAWRIGLEMHWRHLAIKYKSSVPKIFDTLLGEDYL